MRSKAWGQENRIRVIAEGDFLADENMERAVVDFIRSKGFDAYMKDKEKTKAQLIAELETLRARVAELDSVETERKQVEEKIQRNYDTQAVINSLLHLSLKNIPLEELLKRALNIILSIHWLAFEARGSIFLVEDDPDVLVMKAQSGFTKPHQEICARIPFGKCLCGRAALKREIQFADCLDDRHENRYEGITPHGHYCVPILFAGRTLGVINMYVRKGHRRDQREEEFLTVVADTLAGILVQGQAEEMLKKRTEQVIRNQTALLELAKMDNSDLDSALKRITNVDSKTLGVERVSVWFFNEDRSEIICEVLYKLSENFHEKGLRLQAKQYPRYFQAMGESRAIAVNNARVDPRTNEFTEGYLKPFGITSMMDVPVWLHGEVVGIVCHEHTGPRREWTLEEQDFAASIADVVSLALEASKRKRAEELLRESEEKYRTLFEESKDVVFIFTPEGKSVDINLAGMELFGYSSKEELIGVDIRDLYFNLQDRERYQQAMAQQGFVKDYELVLKRKDGHKVIVLVTANAVRDDKGNIVAYRGIMRDVTERRQLEQQLIQAQKMEAVGRLAGGIAHDFNNILTSIIGYAEILEMKLPSEDPILNYIKQILKAADHATTLIQQLLAFSRKAMIQPIVLNLNHVIENFKNILQRMLGEDIVFEFIPSKELETVKVDPSQIEQIIMNLAVNSRDAMPKGGKLIIETNNVELDEEYVKKYPYAKPGRYVLLSVNDAGCGMDAEILSRIFEPFFTTKENGTGLGLSTVYGIVKQSGGYINVYSEVGKGTTVRIYLPRVDEPAEEIVSLSDLSELPRGKEIVLVVEDEETVCELTVRVLSECGYKVLAAKSREEAFSLWEKNAEKIDLLLTDVVMPKMSGLDLAEKFLALKPDLKVLYMSGYSEDIIPRHGAVHKDISFIQKPFTPMELARKIRKVLNS